MKLKFVYAFLRFGSLPTGLLLMWIGWTLTWRSGWLTVVTALLQFLTLLAGIILTLTGAFVIQNVFFSSSRRNRVRPDRNLTFETWSVTNDGMHNSNVDMIWFQNAFYLAHVASPFHFGTTHSRLLVKRSTDGKSWQQVAMFEHSRDDLRDPKFAVIHERLFLYVLLNQATQPMPYVTHASWSEDGQDWSELTFIGHEGWLFWRPKTRDEKTWYVPAYWHKFHHNALFTTTDGTHFEMLATISTGRFINEPEIEFLSDGRMLATGRADYLKATFHQIIGIPEISTIISLAHPPYTDWQETAEDQLTRLDGPVMFSHNQRIYAIGRSHPASLAAFPRRGAVLSKKRTALYEVLPDRLCHISDLPSCGDTSYAGVVIRGGYIYIAYYTNDIQKDFIWLFGMMEPSEIRMVRISLDNLELAATKESFNALSP